MKLVGKGISVAASIMNTIRMDVLSVIIEIVDRAERVRYKRFSGNLVLVFTFILDTGGSACFFALFSLRANGGFPGTCIGFYQTNKTWGLLSIEPRNIVSRKSSRVLQGFFTHSLLQVSVNFRSLHHKERSRLRHDTSRRVRVGSTDHQWVLCRTDFTSLLAGPWAR
jgi:hypothetical protein